MVVRALPGARLVSVLDRPAEISLMKSFITTFSVYTPGKTAIVSPANAAVSGRAPIVG